MQQVLLLSSPESQHKPGLAIPRKSFTPKGTLNIPRSKPIWNKCACLSLRCQAAADCFRHRLAQVALWPESSNGSSHACRSSYAPSANTMAAACAYEEDFASLQPHMDAQDPGTPELPMDSRTIRASEPSPAPEELGHMLALTRIASQMVHGGTATLSAATTPRIAVQLHAQQFACRYRQSKGPAHVVPGQTLRGSLGPAAQGHRTGFMHYYNSLSPSEVTAMLRALPKEHEVAEEALLLPVGSALWALHAAAALRSSSAPPVSPQQMSAHVPTLVLPLAKEWSAKGPLARLWSRFKADVSPLQRCIEAESELPEGLGPWLQQRGVDVKCLESALRALKPCLVQGQDGPVRSVLQGHVRLSRTEHAAIQACFGKEGCMAGAPQHCLEQTDCHARWLCMACGRCAVYWVQRAVLGSGKSVRLAHLASATTELRAVLAMVERTAPPSGMPISLLPGGVPTSTSCLGAGGRSLLTATLPGAGHDFASLRGRPSAFHSYTAQTMGGVSDDSDVEA